MDLKGTKTLENLMKAFAGESQARNRYTFYASVAKKEGYEQIAAIFTETADNEKEHAKVFFKHILEGMASELPITVHVDADYPVELRTTKENLKAAAAGENEEWTILYPEFADVAEKEGFKDVANSFRQIAKVENRHEARYLKLLDNVVKGKVFKREEKVLWKCGNCGYILEAKEAPDICPACKHPKSYFELFCETY
ncbi:MAG TPA: rubrerythrin family protein [Mesotoga infera]|jgi:rubrerythrin|uniref:Rubrerythrin-1 n=1 Tax=Mesotoga infera TaxID=1236046 RepID=A0A7Z7LE97_9BACT|nr:rubrerythrin family protein [Mesotoga infera]HRR45160.1 rubrerythrin family protein [Mesotoga sp.]SSC12367.1 Rubrerythrin-1 [Mesotoga infera]HNR80368.1 rubrerythrin family protein [Mesotoga infera]HPD38988.1 rubrerythrin family protein [Mesotoga infera]HRV02412.1 rubrerythrin family protein [Mesotoga sp.]